MIPLQHVIGQNARPMPRWLLAAALFLCSKGAVAGEASLGETKLANGLRVVVDENHHVPVVAVTVRYRVGSGEDPDSENGLTELVMRMMTRQTEHVADLDAVFDRVGGSFSWSTNLDDSQVYARLPANGLETAFWAFSDMMGFFKPTIDASSVARGVQQVAQHRGQHEKNDPMGLASELITGELFPAGHPYRHMPRAEDATALAAATPAEVSSHVDKYFVPSNATLVVVGDVKPDQVITLATKWFGSIPAGSPPAWTETPLPVLTHEVHLEVASRVERPVVSMSWVTAAQYTAPDADLDVIAALLHGYRIARLSWELITRLKVAGDITTQETSHRRASVFSIIASVTPGHTPQQVADAIDDVLKQLQTSQPPDNDDMEGSLSSALIDQTLSMEQSEYRARQLAQWMLRAGTANYWQSDMRRYETDPQRVQHAAQQYLPLGHRVVAYIVPSTKAPVAGQLQGRTVK
jgi:zinc protease